MLNIDKNYIREVNKKKRLNMSKKEKKIKDRRIYEKIISMEIFKKKDIVLSYVSTDCEVDTISILEYFLKKRKLVGVPLCCKLDINFYFINSLKELKAGSFSILEPEENKNNLVSKAEIDRSICLVPGIAYSFSGHRIGYGKGFYDRFLFRKECLKIGLCYDFNLEEDVFNNYLDVAVDFIITENRILNVV